MVCDEDTSFAGLGREISHLWTSVDEGCQTVVAQSDMLCAIGSCGGWVANRHTETLDGIRFLKHEFRDGNVRSVRLTGLKVVIGCVLRLSLERSYGV